MAENRLEELKLGPTHLPYDEEDEGSAQHQGQHVAEGRKGERHSCSCQPKGEMGRERRGDPSSTLPPLLFWLWSPAASFLLNSELGAQLRLHVVQVRRRCSGFREKLVLRRFASCSAVQYHSGGGVISVAGPLLLVSISERENVRLLLHIFVFSLQPDEPTHAVSLTLQQKQQVSAPQASSRSPGFLCTLRSDIPVSEGMAGESRAVCTNLLFD